MIGVIIIGIIILYIFFSNEIESFIGKTAICNDLDGRCYKVVDKYNNQHDASILLARLNDFSIKLLKHLRNKYIWSYTKNKRAADVVSMLLTNYNPDSIIENAPKNNINTSYVDDKGKVLAICLREKESGKNLFHSYEELQFVLMHEIAHMGTESYGHDLDFWTNFKFLLKSAEEAGLYHPVNYSKNPMIYCSLKVNYNPYFDKTLEDIFSIEY